MSDWADIARFAVASVLFVVQENYEAGQKGEPFWRWTIRVVMLTAAISFVAYSL